MSPVTHGLLSWVIAQTPGIASRRDRALITIVRSASSPNCSSSRSSPDLNDDHFAFSRAFL